MVAHCKNGGRIYTSAALKGGSVISIDTNITDNIIRKVINIQQEKRRIKNGALGNSTLIGYFCEVFPSRTTPSRLILRKEEIRPNI